MLPDYPRRVCGNGGPAASDNPFLPPRHRRCPPLSSSPSSVLLFKQQWPPLPQAAAALEPPTFIPFHLLRPPPLHLPTGTPGCLDDVTNLYNTSAFLARGECSTYVGGAEANTVAMYGQVTRMLKPSPSPPSVSL